MTADLFYDLRNETMRVGKTVVVLSMLSNLAHSLLILGDSSKDMQRCGQRARQSDGGAMSVD